MICGRCKCAVLQQQFGHRYSSQMCATGMGSASPGSTTAGGEWRVVLKEPISKYSKEELCCRGALQCHQFSSCGQCQIRASTEIQLLTHSMLVKITDLSLHLPLNVFSFASLVLCLRVN